MHSDQMASIPQACSSWSETRGLYLRPTYAATSGEREPLGVLDAWMWALWPFQSFWSDFSKNSIPVAR